MLSLSVHDKAVITSRYITLTIVEKAPALSNAAQMIVEDLKKIGVTATAQEREFGQYLNDQRSKKLEFFVAAWQADYPDPQDFLSTLLMTHASQNRYGYANPAFDALCSQADVERDGANVSPSTRRPTRCSWTK